MKRLVIFLFAFAVAIVAFAQTKPLTNADVVQMTGVGFDEQTIVKAIQAHEPAFDTSVDGLVAVKNAGVTKAVIEAMLEAQTKGGRAVIQSPVPVRQAEATSPAPSNVARAASVNEEWPAEVNGMYREVGIYFKQEDRFVQLFGRPVVSAHTGGFLKHSFTMGLSHVTSKGQVAGKHAQLQVPTRQPMFYFYLPENQTPDSFVVVRMDEKGDRREFQTASAGGASGSVSTGLKLQKVNQLIIERVAPRLFRVLPERELEDGEYGFLGSFVVLTAGMAGGGEKVYDFGVHLKRR